MSDSHTIHTGWLQNENAQLRARIAELEALYKPDCTTCARYDDEAGCEWVECYGNGRNCYLAKGTKQ